MGVGESDPRRNAAGKTRHKKVDYLALSCDADVHAKNVS